MGKGVIIIITAVIFFAACKKDCPGDKKSTTVTTAPPRYANWFGNTLMRDTIEFKSTSGFTEYYAVARTEGLSLTSSTECEEHFIKDYVETELNGILFGFTFYQVFRYRHTKDTAILIAEAYYNRNNPINSTPDKFGFLLNLTDTAKNSNYRFYTEYTNQQGQKYPSVHHYTYPSGGISQIYAVEEFYISEKQGLIEYKTVDGVIWSRVK
ncbi:MAG TPA: hypothetical protein VEC12_10080 [Bacteroidia bacterium]|nr:hypothetical protein [Bacteroidia bacterium]